MVVYCYDGTFEGLLTCVYQAYYVKEASDITANRQRQLSLGEILVEVQTEEEKFKKVLTAIYERLGVETFKYLYQAFLSELPSIGYDIYRFLRLAFKVGPEAINDLANPLVDPIRKASISVIRESHLLIGILRFKELKSGIFYATLAPKYRTINLLADHFADRMNQQSWVIHDVKRGYAIIYDTKQWFVSKLESFDVELSEDERYYQAYWKKYFETIAIKERKNPRLQRSFMPKYYWEHLVEIGPST